MRPVRLAVEAVADVTEQLDSDRAQLFWNYDLAAALDVLSRRDVWEGLPHAGVGRRLTVDGITVAGFHAFVAPDAFDPRPDALVVHAISIWAYEWPDDRERS